MSEQPDARPRTVTMHDVARLAGVSHQTVSRVVNERGAVSPETRTAVQRAVDQLGYRVNGVARALASGRSSVIGVITIEPGPDEDARITQAVGRLAAQRGLAVVDHRLDEATLGMARSAIAGLVRLGVSGIVAVGGHRAVSQALAAADGVASVCFDGEPDTSSGPGLGDDVAGALLATRHLLDLGHRDIAHLAGPEEWVEARRREKGWRRALAEEGLRAGEPWRGDWSARSGYEVGRRMAEVPDLTAVFCANDAMALGLLRALDEAGRSVRGPAPVSVAGFGDSEGSAYLVPPLTSVRPDADHVAARALDLLAGDVRAPLNSPAHVVLAVRGSSVRYAFHSETVA